MPSFFFHLAFDLHCLADHDAASSQPLWPVDIFRVRLGTVKQHQTDPRSIGKNSNSTGIDIDITPSTSELVVGLTKDSGKTETSQAFAHDWRYDNISLQSMDIPHTQVTDKQSSKVEVLGHVGGSIGVGPGGLATKGRFEPLDEAEENLGWGIVRLYRDAEETPGLYEDVTPTRSSKNSRNSSKRDGSDKRPLFRDDECTTLCILAVPSYLTPSDFLGFVGEKTRDEVSHFRMIKTEKGNRYMVLMKFRNGKKAREWRKEWNGRTFDSIEPENCHVVFVKSIKFRSSATAGQESSFPDMTNDPFTPSAATLDASPTVHNQAVSSTSLSTKPLAPPTPALVELPTCPVCLERMDESTGLLTILCQHVFHCSCLQKWRGSGCPVCRYTQDDLGKRPHSADEHLGLNECHICRSDANLWMCLICGNVGCGRYDAAHAFSHYQHSSHSFAMDLTTQRVWDYASDSYVHRIVQNKPDGKLVELPSTLGDTITDDPDDPYDDFVPRSKLDNIGLEYTHLLTSQLDSQRMYFEEVVERAADKASQASHAADLATEAATNVTDHLASLQTAYDNLAKDVVPSLERDRDRAQRRADKFEAMARKLEKEWREEKAVSGGLMERVEGMRGEIEGLRGEKRELEEEKRDLTFFISGGERLREVGEEIREGTVSLPDPPTVAAGGKKKGGKGKK